MTQPSDYATLIGSPRDAYAELVRLREENARLRDALAECVTDDGALALHGMAYAKRRFWAINETVHQVLKATS